MKWIVSLAWQSLKYRRQSSIILISAIAIATMFMIFIGVTGSSAIEMINEQNIEHYGKQMLIATGMSISDENHIEADQDFEKLGEIQIVGSIKYNQGSVPLLVGTMDNTAVKTTHIRMASGRLPTKTGEVALENSDLSLLGIKIRPKLNDDITLNIVSNSGNIQKTLRLVGIIDDYTTYWNKQYVDYQSRMNGDFFTPPSIMITKDDAQSFGTLSNSVSDNTATSMNGPRSIWLLDTTLQSAENITSALGKNTGIACNIQIFPKLSEILSPPGSYSDDSGSIWSWVFTGAVLLMAATLCIILNAFILTVEKRRQRIALMRTIGMTKYQSQRIILVETLLMCACGIPVGILLSLCFSYFAVRLFSLISGIGMLYNFWPPMIPIAALLALLTVLLASLLPMLKAGHVPPLAMVQNTPMRRHDSRSHNDEKLTLLRLTFYSMQKGWLRAVFTVLSFVICVFMINLTALLGNHGLYELRQSSIPDYTMATVSSSYNTRNMVFYPTGETDQPTGLSDAVRNGLNVKAITTQIDPFFYITIDKDKIDKYIQQNPFTSNQRNLQVSDQDLQQYGFPTGAKVIRPTVALVDAGTLKQLNAYVAQGHIDEKAVLDGNEIILSLPDYAVENKSDNSQRIYIGNDLNKKPQDIPIVSNTGYHVGDKMTFTSLTSSNDSPNVTKEVKTVTVGAIIRRTSNIDGIGNTMAIVMGDKVPGNWGFSFNISKISVYLPDNSNVDSSEQIVQRLVNSYPNVNLISREQEIAIERQNQREQMTIIAMLAICIASLGVLGLFNTVSTRIYNRRREIAMLRAVGSTRSQVLRMLTYEGALYGLLSAAIGLLVFVLFMELSPLSIENWIQFVSIPLLSFSMFACVALSVLTIFLPAHKVMSGEIIEGVRLMD